MEQEALFDHIDAYIWNILSDEDRQAFEKNLETDEDLRAELALRQLENEAFQLADKAALRTKMKQWREEAATETTVETTQTETKVVSINQGRVVRFSPMRWAAAAAIALMVFVGGRYWATTNYGSDVLAGEFSAKKGTEGEYFGAGGDAKIDAAAMLKEAQTAFQAKNYAQTTSLLQTILADKTVAPNHIQDAEWQMLMTYMANKNTGTDFNSLLAKLVNDTAHAYNKPALELNQKVQSIWWKIAN